MRLFYFHWFAVLIFVQAMIIAAANPYETNQQDYDIEEEAIDQNSVNEVPHENMKPTEYIPKKPRKYYSGIPRSPIMFLFDDQDGSNSRPMYPVGCEPAEKTASTEKVCTEKESKSANADVSSTTNVPSTASTEQFNKNVKENENKNTDKCNNLGGGATVVGSDNSTNGGDTSGSSGAGNGGTNNEKTNGAGSGGGGGVGGGDGGGGGGGGGVQPIFSTPTNAPGTAGDQTQAELQMLIQHLYVAQARVQLETSEIKKAQSIATAAQEELEEATNRVRTITITLQNAQQLVAAAAIRAQTAQLQVAAHDQLLFAARQDVDVLASQVVSLQALQGIETPKINIDMSAVVKKLKEPLTDSEKPTPVPTIVPSPINQKPKSENHNINAEDIVDDLNGN